MSAALAVTPLSVPEFAPGDLDGLCRFVLRRISFELNGVYDDRPGVYQPLSDRLRLAKGGVTHLGRPVPHAAAHTALLAELEADLRELTTASAAVLRRMVQNGGTNANGLSPQAELAARTAAHTLALNPSRPRVSPGELVQRLAAAGVSVRAVGGNLHVTPAALLTEADRAVLREHKAAILEALACPAIL